MDDCIFCEIVKGNVPCDKVYEDEHVLAFNDINPQAPVHVLIIPKQHIVSVAHFTEEHKLIAGHTQTAAAAIAQKLGVDKSGFRLVSNAGADSGQTVFHLHYHLLAGRAFQWPPG